MLPKYPGFVFVSGKEVDKVQGCLSNREADESKVVQAAKEHFPWTGHGSLRLC